MTLPKKAMVIGLDAPITERVYNYAMRGDMPVIRSLIENGVWAENCLVPHPTITPPNWTTIVTGAWPGTHGITCFNIHYPGDPLDKVYDAFNSADCKAEYIWEAVERVGKKTIILNYPSTWPPRGKSIIQVGGAGLGINEWRYENGHIYQTTLAEDQLFSTEVYPQATQINLKEASGWLNAPKASKLLEAELRLVYWRPKISVKSKTWQLLVIDTEEKGFDRILLSKTKNAAEALASLSVGEWTENIVDEFETEKGPRKAAFRCKLVELSKDASKLRLYVTPICALSGWSYPDSVAEEIKSNGLPMSHGGAFRALGLGWVDPETFKEIVELNHIWLADAATYLLKTKEWTLFFMHAHCPDSMYHLFATKMDPSTARSQKDAEFWQDMESALYQSLDKMIEKIISAADEETLIIVTSDHGAKATTHPFPIMKILADAGLLVLKETEKPDLSPMRRPEIDWSKTRAVPQRSCYVYVNLKGRDPQGTVDPGKEYEETRDQIIKALYEYTDSETGKKPITLALRREDARIIGLHGDMTGDIVYAISGDFGGQHGPHLPTTKFGLGSLKGLLIMKGPCIKKNYVMKRTVWLTDIAPTICYLLDLPIPKDAEGGILYQAFEDSDVKIKEINQLRRNYELLSQVYESEAYLSHTKPSY